MADRRMIHRKVIEGDAFYGLPDTAQALYIHLYINADDDGFINCAGSIACRIKNGKAMLRTLVKEGYLLQFGEIYVIRHWRVGNSLKNDRTKLPSYPAIAAQIWIEPNREYTNQPSQGSKTLLEHKTGAPVESSSESNMESSSESQRNRIRTERNGEEQRGTLDGVFDRLWSAYPETRRGNRSQAYAMFCTQITTEENGNVALTTLEQWKHTEQWRKEGGRFIPKLCNWLEQEHWKASLEPVLPSGVAGEFGEAELAAIRRAIEEGA